jgi:hypothetical protein
MEYIPPRKLFSQLIQFFKNILSQEIPFSIIESNFPSNNYLVLMKHFFFKINNLKPPFVKNQCTFIMELLLFASCYHPEKKDDYISQILTLDEYTQTSLMNIMEKVNEILMEELNCHDSFDTSIRTNRIEKEKEESIQNSSGVSSSLFAEEEDLSIPSNALTNISTPYLLNNSSSSLNSTKSSVSQKRFYLNYYLLRKNFYKRIF